MRQVANDNGGAVVPPAAEHAPTDGALLAAVRNGDQGAYGQLVERLFAPVYKAAVRVLRSDAEAEDVTQDVFLKIWRETPELRADASLRGWSVRVATNAAIDRLRKKRPELWDEPPERVDPALGAEGVLSREEAAQSVQQAIDGLPERQRLALVLTYYEGLANKDTAEMMGVSVDALESLLARGRRALKASLAESWSELLEDLGGGLEAEGNWSALG